MHVFSLRRKKHAIVLRSLALASCTIAATAIFSQPSNAQNDDAPTLQIIFDASGSMWGKIPLGSTAKFEAARRAVDAALKKNLKTTKAGLIIFGGSCDGVQVAVPQSANAAGIITDKLNRLNPRSKGPVTRALQAATQNAKSKRGSSIVVIHDGADNCRQDPCAAARDFAKNNKGVPIHLISIDNSETDALAMQCVAKLTGGKVFKASSQEQIEQALVAILKRSERGPIAKATPEKKNIGKKGPRAKPNIDPDGPPHLSLYATLKKNGPDANTPLRWQVFKADEPDTPILDVVEQSFTTPLPANKYVVKAALGLATASQDITVAEKGETVVTLAMNAGLVTFPASAANQEQPDKPESDAVPTFLTLTQQSGSATDETAPPTPILLNTRADNHLTLPAGEYQITVEHGTSKTTKTISVAAGKSQTINLDFETGELRLNAVTSTNDKIKLAPLFKIFVDDPDVPGGRRELARSTAPDPVFALPTGTYYITAQSGNATTSANVALSAGTSVEKTLTLELARLRIRSGLEIDTNTASLPVQYKILRRIGTKQEPIATTGDRTPTFDLKPGLYRVVAEIGALNVVAQSEVELPPGANELLTISAAAGEVQLKLAGKASSLTIDRFWEVRDQNDRIVWRSNQFTPKSLLAPGLYNVKCETRAGTLKKSFEVASGQHQVVELELP